MDLIAFDSPFITEPEEENPEHPRADPDFESTWNALGEANGARGWFDGAIDDVVRRLQNIEHVRLQVIRTDQPPFEGKHMSNALNMEILIENLQAI